MNQQGYIVEIVDSVTAKLKLKRHFACASCGKCATTSEEKYIIFQCICKIIINIVNHK